MVWVREWIVRVAVAMLVLVVSRAPAATVRAGFTATTMVAGLASPTAAGFTPDGRLVILQKGGEVLLWTATGGLRPTLLTIPVCNDSDMGLLGLAFDPGFAANHYLYLYHTLPPGGDVGRCGEGGATGRVNRVVRVKLGEETIDPASLVVILDGLRTSDSGFHNGGGLRVGPDGMLYVAVGDSGLGDGGGPGASTNPYAHDLQQREGKILRITRDGSPPPGNPFVSQGGNAAYVFAYGLRNPFRFAFDPITPGPQLLWAADVGQSTWEEVDVVHPGDDLGWPRCEGPEPLESCAGTSIGPVYAYRHPGNPDELVSVTGGVHYNGMQFDQTYRGDYFFGDFGLNQVYRARMNATRDGFAGNPEIFSDDAGRPVDFFVGPAGALYWVAIEEGAVIRVTQDERPDAALGGCERALGAAAPVWVRRATERLAHCARRGRPCAPPRHLPTRDRVRRRIIVSCDAAARARVCGRLGCARCTRAGDLLPCAQQLAADAAADVTASLLPLGGRCAAAATRASGVNAGARSDAILACVEGGAVTCVPPPSLPEPHPAGRECADPAPVCAALGCGACTGDGELATCLAAAVRSSADALASTFLGLVR